MLECGDVSMCGLVKLPGNFATNSEPRETYKKVSLDDSNNDRQPDMTADFNEI